MDYLESIPEAKYLSAENSVSYRFIMRLFYLEYQKMNYQLDKDEILSRMQSHPLFARYAPEQLIRDLDQLTEWKNLTAIQDPRRVYTIADFKNRQYQYMMTQRGVEVERMTIKLEEISTRTAGLSANAFRQIRDRLHQAERLASMSSTEVHDWWDSLQGEFYRMSGQYQDYLWRFYDPSSEKNMKSTEFVTYKQQLIRYLKDFIQELQHGTEQIGAQLEALSSETEADILTRIVQSELSIPRPESERTSAWQEEIRVRTEGIWHSIKNWFLGESATARQALEVTNEVIRKTVQNAALLVQMENMGSGNKTELRHMMKLFAESPSLDEAHRLSALVFGAQRARHFTIHSQYGEIRNGSSVYEGAAVETVLQPRSRTYKARTPKGGFADKSAEKAAQRKKILEEERTLRGELDTYIRDGTLDFQTLKGPVSPQALTVMLNWIHLASLDPDRRGYTQYGQPYTLHMREGPPCVLTCRDGTLMMPDCALLFDKGGTDGMA